jgi:S1-C subfamily serine protease
LISFGFLEDFMKVFSFPDIGCIFDFSEEPVRKQKLGIKIQDTENNAGVKILEVEDESAGASAGLMKDDIIVEINGHKVTNTDEAREELKESPENNGYSILALRNGKELKFDVKNPKKLKTADL